MTNRLAIVQASAAFLVALCKRGAPRYARIVANPLPDDAEFVRAGYDDTGAIRIVVSSASFAEVENGGVIPELPPPTFEVVYGAEK